MLYFNIIIMVRKLTVKILCALVTFFPLYVLTISTYKIPMYILCITLYLSSNDGPSVKWFVLLKNKP